MGKTEKRELISRVTVLLLHLLNMARAAGGARQFVAPRLPMRATKSADLLADNPSLTDRPPRVEDFYSVIKNIDIDTTPFLGVIAVSDRICERLSAGNFRIDICCSELRVLSEASCN